MGKTVIPPFKAGLNYRTGPINLVTEKDPWLCTACWSRNIFSPRPRLLDNIIVFFFVLFSEHFLPVKFLLFIAFICFSPPPTPPPTSQLSFYALSNSIPQISCPPLLSLINLGTTTHAFKTDAVDKK